MSETVETLKRFEVLSSLTPAELALVARHAEPVSLPAGGHLFREGEPGDALYLVTEGLVVVERTIDAAAGHVKPLALLPSGSHVGEMALADDEPRSASVRAELATKALRVSRAGIEALAAESPAAAIKLFRALFAEASHRLRVTNEELLAVYEVGKFVAGAADPPRGVACTILGSLTARLDAAHGAVALYDAKTNSLRVTYAWGDRERDLMGAEMKLTDGLLARAYDEKKPLLIERLLGPTEPWESSSMLILPLLVRDRPTGLLVLGERGSAEPYRTSDLSLATAVSNISAPVLADAFPL